MKSGFGLIEKMKNAEKNLGNKTSPALKDHLCFPWRTWRTWRLYYKYNIAR
ncbi:hypothetical protein NIES2100_61140 [Calothrix sp. NIES-2100]|nr:hypothetical protein NIES2100_61140 [Calothrix sp. NIES-2100]